MHLSICCLRQPDKLSPSVSNCFCTWTLFETLLTSECAIDAYKKVIKMFYNGQLYEIIPDWKQTTRYIQKSFILTLKVTISCILLGKRNESERNLEKRMKIGKEACLTGWTRCSLKTGCQGALHANCFWHCPSFQKIWMWTSCTCGGYWGASHFYSTNNWQLFSFALIGIFDR